MYTDEVAIVTLVGGPREGVRYVYGGAPLDLIASLFPGYRLVWSQRDPEDHRDPMAEYQWAARFEYIAG